MCCYAAGIQMPGVRQWLIAVVIDENLIVYDGKKGWGINDVNI